MVTVTKDQYLAYTNKTEDNLPQDFTKLLNDANLIIWNAVRYAYERASFSHHEEYVQIIVMAVSHQVDYWDANGETADTPSIQSFTAGNLSVTNVSSGNDDRTKLKLCSMAYNILKSAGLLYKGVITL